MIKHFSRSRQGRLTAVAGALTLAGGALFTGVAAAQTPSGGGDQIPPLPPSGAPFTIALPADGGCILPAAQAVQAVPASRIAANRDEFAVKLAQALGKPVAEVQRALAETEPPMIARGEIRQVFFFFGDEAALAPAASQLGVTPAELKAALEEGGRTLCDNPPPRPAENAPVGPPTALFEAVAEVLGRGITAAGVQAALEANRPSAPPNVTRIAIEATPLNGHLQSLAGALGVTVEELDAALRSIAPGPRVMVPAHP